MTTEKPSDIIKRDNPIDAYLLSKGVKLIGSGKERRCICPFHKDKTPSMSVNVESGVWTCHVGCGGGSVIDLMARFENTTANEILRRALKSEPQPQRQHNPGEPRPEIERIYPYLDANGEKVFEVVRLKPKSFRQRHMGPDGKWVWNMDGVQRVLFHLPDLMLSPEVWIVEGEKDAETLFTMGLTATCNVGGAGKWLDAYTDSLAGKDVILCGDTDDAGMKHVILVRDSLAGKVKSTRTVWPPKPHKDVSDFVAAVGVEQAKAELLRLASEAPKLFKGVDVPVFSLRELEAKYSEHAKNLTKTSLNLSGWLPSLQNKVRSILPGELIAFVADTGTGKTALLSNLAIHAAPLSVLFFELELPDTLLFERLLAARLKWQCKYIELGYQQGDKLGDAEFQGVDHIHVCTRSRLTVEDLEKIIINSELKIGHRPQVVVMDYIQLLQGEGKSRYERTSNIAEQLKIVAKETNTVVVIASQVARPGNQSGPEISLHDAKDSGSIESSAGLVIGAWRDSEDKSTLWLQILKNTKGSAGDKIECNFDGASMVITERDRRVSA